jgi:hypothetical protein
MAIRTPTICAVLCAVATAGAAAHAPGRLAEFDYAFVENQLRSGSDNRVEFQQLSDTPVVYRAWGVWNLPYPAPEVGRVALDLSNYEHIFRNVYQCRRISEPRARIRRGQSTWYVEGRAAIARVWSIGVVDTISWTDSTHLRFFASQTEDPVLEAKWSSQLSGWLNYRTHGVRLAAFVVPAGRDSCRLGIVAQGWVWQPMPQWLVRLATAIILPRLLSDLDKEVARRIAVQAPPSPPWYKSWYHAIRRFVIF